MIANSRAKQAPRRVPVTAVRVVADAHQMLASLRGALHVTPGHGDVRRLIDHPRVIPNDLRPLCIALFTMQPPLGEMNVDFLDRGSKGHSNPEVGVRCVRNPFIPSAQHV